MNILEQIVRNRASRINRQGPALGVLVPKHRETPLVPFCREPSVIAEIKRKSPSRGEIGTIYNPVKQAEIYASAGDIKTISILTEEDHFSGSLDDLIAVKGAFPELAILRKDFLLTREDIDISYRAGADAVLLIAAVLERETLEELFRRTKELGMAALVEVHSEDDITKAESIAPEYLGINSRDLTTFRTDPLLPLGLRQKISWETRIVYESGIRGGESAELAGRAGFSGLLVGETAVKRPEALPDIIQGFTRGKKAGENDDSNHFFWNEIAARITEKGKTGKKNPPPLVKICGLTRIEDVRMADDFGADILGFVLADSPRKTTAEFIENLGPTKALKAAVVVETHPPLMAHLRRLLERKKLDVLQIHGDYPPGEYSSAAYPYYKALTLGSPGDTEKIANYRCPRVLVDAHREGFAGGTGKRIDRERIEAVRTEHPLWIAGGLDPRVIGEIVNRYSPELVDASSGLESKPGKKDRILMKEFISLAKG